MRRRATGCDRALTPACSSACGCRVNAGAELELARGRSVDRARHALGGARIAALASRVRLPNSSPTSHNMENPMLIATSLDRTNVSAFDSNDAIELIGVLGGQGQQPAQPRPPPQQPAQPQPTFMQRWGRTVQTGGEYAMAAGAVG